MNRLRYQCMKLSLLLLVLLFTTTTVEATIVPSDSSNYEVMAIEGDYTMHFNDFNTNGFAYTNNGYSLSFLPRGISYTDDSGNISLMLGRAQSHNPVM